MPKADGVELLFFLRLKSEVIVVILFIVANYLLTMPTSFFSTLEENLQKYIVQTQCIASRKMRTTTIYAPEGDVKKPVPR
jgi:hypothetical protein